MGRPRLLLNATRLVFVHLNVLEVDFPKQTVELLLVAPVAVQHKRYYRQNQQNYPGDCCGYLSCIADALLATEAALGFGNRRLTADPWYSLRQLQTLRNENKIEQNCL